MTFTSPFTAVTGAIITASGWNTSGRDNINHLRGLLPDPGGAPAILKQATSTTAAFGQLVNAEIADNTIDLSLKAATGSLTGAKTANKTIAQSNIALLAIGTPELIDDAVTTAKILDANVTTAKIADSNVTTAKIADSNVTTAKIADSNVTTAKILDANVTYAKLATSVWKAGKEGSFTGAQALTTSDSDVAGASFTADRDGTWLIITHGEFSMAAADGFPELTIVAGGVSQGFGRGPGGLNINAGVAIASDVITVSGSTTIKAQVKKTSGAGGSLCSFVKIVGIWTGP